MATSRREGGNQTPQWASNTKTGGQILDGGPYVGVIKNNLDPTRSGRLQVYIPDLGGDENDVRTWRTVSYASPFFGSTFQPEATQITSHTKVHHTYGMWMVTPDIGNEVLVVFAGGGDPSKGYWIACINKHLSHNQYPAISNPSFPADRDHINSSLVKNSIARGGKLPLGEFNENKPSNITEGFLKIGRSIHETQAELIIHQGLDIDTKCRGTISSSSQREVPSNVFGISTPGRPVKDPTLDPDYQERLKAGRLQEDDYAVRERLGGHSFIMDDGDKDGKNGIIRLRTSLGHQILMNDSDNFIQIINDNGTCWMEMNSQGQLMVYAYGGVHMRTEGEMNFHADKNINFHAKNNFNIYAGNNFNLDVGTNLTIKANEMLKQYAGNIAIGTNGNIVMSADSKIDATSTGPMNLSGSKLDLNTAPGPRVANPGKLKQFYHTDASRAKWNDPWTEIERANTSINTVVPAHEPWTRQTGEAATDTSFVLGDVLAAAQSTRLDSVATIKAELEQYTIGAGLEAVTRDVTTTPVQTAQQEKQPIDEKSAGKPTNGLTDQPPAPDRTGGIADAQGKPTSRTITKSDLSRADAPPVTKGIGTLSPEQTQALKTSLAKSESDFDYRAINDRGYVGRYQMGSAALVDTGLIKMDYHKKFGNKAMLMTNAWTPKANALGVNNLKDFLNNASVQESAVDALLAQNFKTMSRVGGLVAGDTASTVAGMLQTAHLLGAGDAAKWRAGANPTRSADAYGTTGIEYFNRGRKAIELLDQA